MLFLCGCGFRHEVQQHNIAVRPETGKFKAPLHPQPGSHLTRARSLGFIKRLLYNLAFFTWSSTGRRRQQCQSAEMETKRHHGYKCVPVRTPQSIFLNQLLIKLSAVSQTAKAAAPHGRFTTWEPFSRSADSAANQINEQLITTVGTMRVQVPKLWQSRYQILKIYQTVKCC